MYHLYPTPSTDSEKILSFNRPHNGEGNTPKTYRA